MNAKSFLEDVVSTVVGIALVIGAVYLCCEVSDRIDERKRLCDSTTDDSLDTSKAVSGGDNS